MSTAKKGTRKRKSADDATASNGIARSREIRASRRQPAANADDAIERIRRIAKEHPLLLIGAGVLAGGVALRVAGVAARIPLLRGLVAGSLVSSLAGFSADTLEKVRGRFARG